MTFKELMDAGVANYVKNPINLHHLITVKKDVDLTNFKGNVSTITVNDTVITFGDNEFDDTILYADIASEVASKDELLAGICAIA